MISKPLFDVTTASNENDSLTTTYSSIRLYKGVELVTGQYIGRVDIFEMQGYVVYHLISRGKIVLVYIWDVR